MHKMIARILITISLFLLTVTPVLAQATDLELTQSQAQIVNTEGVTLELVQGTQHPESKAINFTLTVKSQITSDRAQVRWEIAGPAELVSGNKTETLSLRAGQTYTYSIILVPRGSNRVDLRAVVEAFQIDGTRQATATKALVFSGTGEILFPQEGQHQLAKTILTVRNISGITLIILLAGVFIYRGGKFVFFWLNN